jgi:hypothetical protein
LNGYTLIACKHKNYRYVLDHGGNMAGRVRLRAQNGSGHRRSRNLLDDPDIGVIVSNIQDITEGAYRRSPSRIRKGSPKRFSPARFPSSSPRATRRVT